MRYCIQTQKDFMMSTLSIKGIEWKVSCLNGKTAYTHRTITISWVDGSYQTKNHLGQVIFSHERASVCLEDASLRILEAYAQRFVPCWGPDEEEISITWEEAA